MIYSIHVFFSVYICLSIYIFLSLIIKLWHILIDIKLFATNDLKTKFFFSWFFLCMYIFLSLSLSLSLSLYIYIYIYSSLWSQNIDRYLYVSCSLQLMT